MAGMRSDDGLIYVIGGGQYVNIKGEDRGGEEYIDLVFTNADAYKLGQLLIQESGLTEEPELCTVCQLPYDSICHPDPKHPGYSYCGRTGGPKKVEGDVIGHVESFDEKTGLVTFRLDDGTAQKLGLRQTTDFSIYTKAD